MKYEPLSLFEFQKRFKNEKSCLKALEKIRWPNGFECPRCHHDHAYHIAERHQHQCARCGYQASLTAGTLFHKTRTPLQKWFWAIYLVSQDKGGVAALRLAKQLDLGYKTAWLMLQKIRTAMGDRDARYQLKGLVEVDDAFFGGVRAGKVGRGADNKTKVVVMVESRGAHAGYLSMKSVDHVSAEEVEAVIEQKIMEGSTLKTDGYPSYKGTSKIGYTHQGMKVPPKQASTLLPWVHIAIANAKRFLLGTYHGVSHKHMMRYLDEYCYRFNRRWSEKDMTSRLISACVLAGPITYAELTG